MAEVYPSADPSYRGGANLSGASLEGADLSDASLLGAILGLVSWPYVNARAVVSIFVSLAYTYPMHTRFVFRAVQDADDGAEP